MFRNLFILPGLLFAPALLAQAWNCQSKQAPQECQGSVLKQYGAEEHACLLKLYTCGRYQDAVTRIESTTVGLAPEQNYFLGASYFGLSDRTDAQSLKCLYVKKAKAQLEEFLLATQSNPASEVTYGSEAQMDLLYHAQRTFDLLRKEPGCAESSHSEGSLYRMARLHTAQRMQGLLHDFDKSGDEASIATRSGFKAMRDTFGLFVTEASRLETRFSLYSSQIDSSNAQIARVAEFLQKTALNESIIAYATDPNGALQVTVDHGHLRTFLDTVENDLQNKGISVLNDFERRFDDYATRNTKYYDQLREENLKAFHLIIARMAMHINVFKESGDGPKKLREVDDRPQGRLESMTRMSQVWTKFRDTVVSKQKCKSAISTVWYCQKSGENHAQ
ncbi:MAG: hypothetical protein M3Q07_26070 [Pseudobdellovibrionaceae bacterium]|nr:hypothetical protein [Pseudobdellovibrionaceae bacterium]